MTNQQNILRKTLLLLWVTLGCVHANAQFTYPSFSPKAPVCEGWGCWVGFLKYVPASMGPNALPVPESYGASVEKECAIETRLVGHNATGDKTQNVYMDIDIPVLAGVVSVGANGNVYETYKLSNARREKLAAWYGPGKGTLFGDISFYTKLQLIRSERFVDVAIRFNFRTTSGYYLPDARYSDTPGFFSDISAGKSFASNLFRTIRPYAAIGFYSWSTNSFRHMQNDAILYNAGVLLMVQQLTFQFESAGYHGYEGNGDQPLAIRCNVLYDSKRLTYKLGYQKGLHDFDYTSLLFSGILKFNTSAYFKTLVRE